MRIKNIWPATRFERFSQRRGITLIEMLAVIVIFAALFSILVPALSSAKGRAGEVACLSHIRQSGLDLFAHAAENKGFMAAPERVLDASAPNGAPWGAIRFEGEDVIIPFVSVKGLWPALLVDHHADLSNHLTCSGMRTEDDFLNLASTSHGHNDIESGVVIPSTYVYSSSFLAPPAYFDPTEPDVSTVGAQQWSSVAHPSKKIVLYEDVVVHRTGQPESPLWTPMGNTVFLLSDGHAAARSVFDVQSPVPAYTHWGVHGRDF